VGEADGARAFLIAVLLEARARLREAERELASDSPDVLDAAVDRTVRRDAGAGSGNPAAWDVEPEESSAKTASVSA
jgi:hypothetical protein